MYGLRPSDLKVIRDVIARHSDVESAWIYGSRAIGREKSGSDVDLAIKGQEISHETVINLSRALNEESPLPYHFDITNYHNVQNDALKQHIDEAGVLIYPNH